MKNLLFLGLIFAYSQATFAADKAASKAEPSAASPEAVKAAEADAEASDLEKVKHRYWAQGEEGEIGVVQNRTYAKKGRFEVGINGGLNFVDPFISVKTLGGDLGLNISEYFAVHALYRKDFVSGSGAQTEFDKISGKTNTNRPISFYGAEALGSVFYGKLSVMGAAIIYYDLHLAGGAGFTKTESGTYFTPVVGIGQRFYFNKYLSLRLDYRLQYYRETVLEKVIITKIGDTVGQRNVFANGIQLGVEILLPGGF